MDFLDVYNFRINDVNPTTIIFSKLNNPKILSNFIRLEQLLYKFCPTNEILRSQLMLDNNILNNIGQIKELTNDNMLLRTGLWNDKQSCEFCKDICNWKHLKMIYNATITEFESYNVIATKLYNINSYCMSHFITTILLSPYYNNILLLLVASFYDSTFILNSDLIKIIVAFIVYKCKQH